MSEENTVAELAQVAHRAYWVTLLRGEEPTDAYDDEEAEYQRAWDASAQAVAAHVAGPDAAGCDSAAEIMRLRDRLRMLLADTPFEFRPDWAAEYLGDDE